MLFPLSESVIGTVSTEVLYRVYFAPKSVVKDAVITFTTQNYCERLRSQLQPKTVIQGAMTIQTSLLGTLVSDNI